MRIGIGIDTGGTYTDAVVCDLQTREILGTAKAPTTRDDLSRGILQALDALPQEIVRKAAMAALSTTLATNACVEGKGGHARLVFFGGDPRTIDTYGTKYGLPPMEQIYIPKTVDGRTPDWQRFDEEIGEALAGQDGVGIVEMDAQRTGAALEAEARRRIQEETDIPVVCGGELFMDLNAFQRGASTLLNARLFPVVREFLYAMRAALKQRGLDIPMVIVRSDGSVMSEAFTELRPVETLLSGPAASVMGACGLTREANSIIVDMGGTTTDIALVRGGEPLRSEDGIRVGEWRTCVKGLDIDTMGLGGDSAIHAGADRVTVESYRVMPLCALAARYPKVRDTLQALVDSEKKHTRPLHEHYVLIRQDAGGDLSCSEQERRLCKALKEGPLSLREAAQAAGTDIYNFDVSGLIRSGAVQVCGLTPTDIMHVRGEFVKHDALAASLAAQYVGMQMDMDVETLCGAIYKEVKRRLYASVVKILLEHENPYFAKHGFSADVQRLIDANYELAASGGEAEFITLPFRTDFTLIGIGAPIHVFLPDVARMMGTRAIVPEHAEVANALGAVLGKVYAVQLVEIRPELGVEGLGNFTLSDGVSGFETKEEAVEAAIGIARRSAWEEARRRGVQGDITVTHEVRVHEGRARASTVYLGTTVAAYAYGMPAAAYGAAPPAP